MLQGRAHAIQLRKHHAIGNLRDEEMLHAKEISVAIDNGDLGVLANKIQLASEVLGSSHPVVEAARREHKQRRGVQQYSEWIARVNMHEGLLRDACISKEPTAIEKQLEAAIGCVGLGHPMVLEGKRALLRMKKEQQWARNQQEQLACSAHLRELVHDAELSLECLEERVVRRTH